jgi:integrase/recombinase XerC
MKELILKERNDIAFESLMQRYLEFIDVSNNTTRTYNVGLIQFNEYLKRNNITTPTREDVINFREYLKEEHKPNTVNAYLIAVRNFYSWLEYEDITKDITKKIKGIKLERHHLKRGLSEEEIRRVLSVCKDTRETLLIKLMITCALRINEVANIELSDFFNDKGVVMLKVLGKARDGLKQDAVKIDNRLFDLIKDYCNEYQVEDYLFYSTSNHNKGGKMSTKCLREIITNLFKKAELDMTMLTSHSLRHSACEMLLENGMPLQEVSEFMRHRSILTTTIYSKELDHRKCQASNVLGNYVFE